MGNSLGNRIIIQKKMSNLCVKYFNIKIDLNKEIVISLG